MTTEPTPEQRKEVLLRLSETVARIGQAHAGNAAKGTAARRFYTVTVEMASAMIDECTTDAPFTPDRRRRLTTLLHRFRRAEADRKRTVKTPYGPVLRDALLELRNRDTLLPFETVSLLEAIDDIYWPRVRQDRCVQLTEALRRLHAMAVVVVDGDDDGFYDPCTRPGQSITQLASDLLAALESDKRKGMYPNALYAVGMIATLADPLPQPRALPRP